MKIAIDVSPLQSGHKIRGVGFYLEYLKRALTTYFPQYEYTFFTQQSEIPAGTDLVHYPYFDPFFLTLPFKKKYKTVVTVHDLTPIVFPQHFPAGVKGTVRWQIQKQNLKRVDGIICDSVASKNDIVRIVGVDADKVDVAYLAGAEEFRQKKLEKPAVEALLAKYVLPHQFVLYVGDVTWNKNVPMLVKACTMEEIPLVMVGKSLVQTEFDRSNPWNKDLVEVQSLAKDNPFVHMLGFVPTEDLVSLYNRATVFVFPSVYEGFGLPILEAMQSGCPVIVSKEGCMPEVAGEAAYYFDGYDQRSLQEAIKHVYHTEAVQKELSTRGLEQAKKFSWKQTAEQTVEVYKKAAFS